MLISDVENIVGLSKKSIRFYEENGLLSPRRKEENGYRIYTDEDIYKLKVIKFLRELDVPIKEIYQLNNNELSLSDCLKERIQKINAVEEKYLTIKKLCEEIIDAKIEFNEIKIDKYFQNVRILNKEGFTMQNTKSNKKKQIFGAALSSLIFNTIFIIILAVLCYFQFTLDDNCPWLIFILLILVLGLLVFCIFYNLVVRIKEILGGEEDEASKY